MTCGICILYDLNESCVPYFMVCTKFYGVYHMYSMYCMYGAYKVCIAHIRHMTCIRCMVCIMCMVVAGIWYSGHYGERLLQGL